MVRDLDSLATEEVERAVASHCARANDTERELRSVRESLASVTKDRDELNTYAASVEAAAVRLARTIDELTGALRCHEGLSVCVMAAESLIEEKLIADLVAEADELKKQATEARAQAQGGQDR